MEQHGSVIWVCNIGNSLRGNISMVLRERFHHVLLPMKICFPWNTTRPIFHGKNAVPRNKIGVSPHFCNTLTFSNFNFGRKKNHPLWIQTCSIAIVYLSKMKKYWYRPALSLLLNQLFSPRKTVTSPFYLIVVWYKPWSNLFLKNNNLACTQRTGTNKFKGSLWDRAIRV